jgi:hypothetical protein
MPTVTGPQKITFGEMRSTGVRGLLIYCSDYHCSHSIAIKGDRWPDGVRLSDLEPRFVCKPVARKAPTSGRTSIGASRQSRRWAVEVFRPNLGRRATPQQLPISLSRRPFGSREVTVEGTPRPIRLPLRVNVQNDARDLAPVGAWHRAAACR